MTFSPDTIRLTNALHRQPGETGPARYERLRALAAEFAGRSLPDSFERHAYLAVCEAAANLHRDMHPGERPYSAHGEALRRQAEMDADRDYERRNFADDSPNPLPR